MENHSIKYTKSQKKPATQTKEASSKQPPQQNLPKHPQNKPTTHPSTQTQNQANS